MADPDFDRQSPLAFSPDGDLFVTCDAHQHLNFWNLHTLRHDLAAIGLDWKIKPLEAAQVPVAESVEVERPEILVK